MQVVDEDRDVAIFDVANVESKKVLESVAGQLLFLRKKLDEVPADQRAYLIVTNADIDRIFEVLEPIHAKA